MKHEIKGKVVAITGASSGIGEATAILLASLGAKLVLGVRPKDRMGDLITRIEKEGGDAVYTVTDVRSHNDLLQLVALAMEQYGRLDVIINNAGQSHLSRFDALDIEGREERIDIDLKEMLHGTAAAMPVFISQGSGHIVNISSMAGRNTAPAQPGRVITYAQPGRNTTPVQSGRLSPHARTISEPLRQGSGGRLHITGINPISISPENIAEAVVLAIGKPSAIDVSAYPITHN